MRRGLPVALALAVVAGCSGSRPGSTQTDADADGPDDVAPGRDGGAAGADAAKADGPKGNDAGDAPRDAMTADADARADADAATHADAVTADQHVASVCDYATQTLPIPSAAVAGVLTGTSRNPAVSCEASVATKGPDAFFTLNVDAYTIVELTVTSVVDTLVAVRSGCGENTTEVACGDLPPDSSADAGAPAGGGADAAMPFGDASVSDLRVSSVRVGLAAGSYTVIVDTLTLGPATSAPFTIAARVIPPADNASCAAPTLLTSNGTAQGDLDFSGQPTATCGGGTGGELFYAVGVPAGERLTVQAAPTAGDRGWMPTVSAFSACGGTTCLAQGRTTAGVTQQLDWVNNGTNWRLVTFAIGADGPVHGAQFTVSATVTDLLASCERPTPVHDGTALTGQNLADALMSTTLTCLNGPAQALYYVATLLPQQEIDVQANATDNSGASFNIGLRSSCTDQCPGLAKPGSTTNVGSTPETVIIEITSTNGVTNGSFELDVSIPPPPAGINVTPTSGLVTSEDGTTATFQVVLMSPPTSDVTIAIASDTPTEGKASPGTLVFDATDWSVPQTVTVTGVDDQVPDGARDYLIVTSPAVSADVRYSGLDAADVAATNLDNDPGLTFDGANELVTSEAGTSTSFQVRLNRKPTSSVTVPLSSSNLNEGQVSPASLTFTTDNWQTPQTVTVTGVDDAVTDGTRAYAVVTGAFVSADPAYGGQNPPDVTVHNLDDDYKAVGVKLISGAGTCNIPSTPAPIALDAFNTIYVVLDCDGALSLLTSTDGGVTFSAPADIPGTSSFSGTYTIAAGGGTLYLVLQTPSGAFEIMSTKNAGTTWSPPTSLALPGPVTISAGLDTVVAISPDPNGTNTVLQRSIDGGRTFLPRQSLAFPTSSVVVEPDGKTVWVTSFVDPNTTIFESTDAGGTFTSITSDAIESGFSAVGHKTFVELESDQTRVVDLTDPTMITEGPASTISVDELVFDDRDDVTALGTDETGTHTVALRVNMATPSDPVTIGPHSDVAGGVALSRSAVASLLYSNQLMFFAVTTF
jgi:hypothetical protein